MLHDKDLIFSLSGSAVHDVIISDYSIFKIKRLEAFSFCRLLPCLFITFPKWVYHLIALDSTLCVEDKDLQGQAQVG